MNLGPQFPLCWGCKLRGDDEGESVGFTYVKLSRGFYGSDYVMREVVT
jgi:hypothetical protein